MSGEINDSDRLDALGRLLRNCPHAQIIYNDDTDAEDPAGFTLRVEGCETSEDTAGDLRSCLDFEVRRQRIQRWESVAYWPRGTCGGNDISTDIHDSKEAAEAVCRMLERMGFGGNRLVFPTRTEARIAR